MKTTTMSIHSIDSRNGNRHFTARLAGSVLAAAVLASGGAACAGQLQLTARVAAHPIAIDGDASDQDYVEALWSRRFEVLEPEDPNVNGLYLAVDKKFTAATSRVGAFADADNLYFCFLCPFPKDVPPTASDSVECHLCPAGTTVWRVAVDMTGKVSCARYDGGDPLKATECDIKGVQAAVRQAKGSFTVEVKIPFASLGGKAGPKGRWRCNFIRRGASCGGTSSWAPTNRELASLELFGDMTFEASPDADAELEPLPENKGKSVFLWSDGPWHENVPEVRAPLGRKELAEVNMAGFRGSRAIAAFRMSNLTDRPALYNLNFNSADAGFESALRLRELAYIELRGRVFRPDPIFDLPIGSVLRIPARSTAIVWMDVDCTNLTPGRHLGRLRCVPGYSGFDERVVRVCLQVGNADLSEVKMPVHYYYNTSHVPTIAPLAKDYGFNLFLLKPYRHFYEAGCVKGGKGREICGFENIDSDIDTLVKAGVPKDELRFMFYALWPKCAKIGFDKSDKKDCAFLSPEWKERYARCLLAAVRYLKEKHGFTYDRLYFSTNDEPNGDPDDPSTSAYAAIHGAEFVKSVAPGLQLSCNPWNETDPARLARYFKVFDTLVPSVRRFMDDKADRTVPNLYRDSGRQIRSYVVFAKQNTARQHRRCHWANMDLGWQGSCAVYGLVQATGDQFNSYDTVKSKRRTGSTVRADYNTCFNNPRTNQITPSLRLESWYQGLIDLKLVKWCRMRLDERKKAGKNVDRLEQAIKEIVSSGNSPLCDYEALRKKLTAIADRLSAERKQQ